MAKKILLVGTFFPYPGPVSRFAKDVQNLNYDFSRFSRTPHFRKKAVKRAILTPCNTAAFPLSLSKADPKIVHIHATDRNLARSYYYLTWAKLLKRKVIIQYHGENIERAYKKSVLKSVIRSALRSANKIIVYSEKDAEFVSRRFNSSVEPIKHYVNIDDYSKTKKKSKKVRILFAGNLDRTRGIGDMLKAIPLVIKKNKDVEFTFLGHGDKTSWYSVCKLMNIEKHVSFIGYLSSEDRIRLFKEADIFALPSHVSAFPTTVLEAMASNTPIITTSVGSVKEVIEDDKNGFLVRKGDYIELAGKLNFLVEHKKTRERIGMNNLRKVQEYDKEKVISSIDRIYKSL